MHTGLTWSLCLHLILSNFVQVVRRLGWCTLECPVQLLEQVQLQFVTLFWNLYIIYNIYINYDMKSSFIGDNNSEVIAYIYVHGEVHACLTCSMPL